jgi:predicted HTH domain antitoxin
MAFLSRKSRALGQPDLLGRLSSGQAAKLCGMARVQFLLALPRIGVKVSNLSVEDADDELAFARNG